MAISQNSKITWEDIRDLFDRVNAERNRFKYTPDSPLNLQNQPAKAEIPNRLNDLIKTMNTNTFIKNGTSIANIGNFAVNVGELIIAQKLANMASLLGEIENIASTLSFEEMLQVDDYIQKKNFLTFKKFFGII